MSAAERFVDTNVLLYLISADAGKADRAEQVLGAGGVISVQVLNEFAAIALRKLALSMAEVREVLATVRAACRLVPLDGRTHDLGLRIAEDYQLSLYDAMIVAAALLANCTALLSEDLQHGQRIEGRLLVQNPFRAADA